VHERLDETLVALAAGNPEWRDEDVQRSTTGEQATA
jgi:hypothetical protein